MIVFIDILFASQGLKILVSVVRFHLWAPSKTMMLPISFYSDYPSTSKFGLPSRFLSENSSYNSPVALKALKRNLD